MEVGLKVGLEAGRVSDGTRGSGCTKLGSESCHLCPEETI